MTSAREAHAREDSDPATARAASPGTPRGELPPPTGADPGLHAALGEDAVVIPSSVVIEGIDLDRPWACAGDPVRASARIGGEVEPGAVYRWVWMAAEEKAELHPGPTMLWPAPQAPGRYAVHFQVCKDLGGRGVGILADRAAIIEVRSCTEGERQARATEERLRIRATQRRHGAFAFEATYEGGDPVAEYAWDFGDGRAETTTEAHVEHTYASSGLDPHDVASFTVRLEARSASGARLEATTVVLTRERLPTGDPPPIDLEISRWRPSPDGAGWQSDIAVMSPPGAEVTWDHVERVTRYFDDREEVDPRPWREVIAVDERLERGGFRGRVLVSAEETGPGVKQIVDVLVGSDAAGEEIVVSWTPFKR